MDTLIERKKRFTPKQIYGGTGVLFILVLILYFIFRDTGSSMTIDKSRITIATVTENEFTHASGTASCNYGQSSGAPRNQAGSDCRSLLRFGADAIQGFYTS